MENLTCVCVCVMGHFHRSVAQYNALQARASRGRMRWWIFLFSLASFSATAAAAASIVYKPLVIPAAISNNLRVGAWLVHHLLSSRPGTVAPFVLQLAFDDIQLTKKKLYVGTIFYCCVMFSCNKSLIMFWSHWNVSFPIFNTIKKNTLCHLKCMDSTGDNKLCQVETWTKTKTEPL